MFNNLRELILSMPTEKACVDYLAKQRWADGKAVCPYCQHPKCYVIEGGERYKCASKECYKRFKITVGTIFEASNIPLSKWFTAIYLVTAHKKGISSYQLGKDISVTQKSAWFMLHRIREVMRVKSPVTLGIDKPVEADEMYVGGSISNKHISKRKKYAENPALMNNKTTVLGMIERDGQLVTKVMKGFIPDEVQKTITDTIQKDARLITDASNLYNKMSETYNHEFVNHAANEYIRGNTYTNTIEGAFSHFKRMVYGIYHQISPKHTQRYCDEFSHRFNTRKLKDADRFSLSLKQIECRLRYTQLINVSTEGYAAYASTTILQFKDGEVINTFTSIKEAARLTGIDRRGISRAANGKSKKAGGFNWTFA